MTDLELYVRKVQANKSNFSKHKIVLIYVNSKLSYFDNYFLYLKKDIASYYFVRNSSLEFLQYNYFTRPTSLKLHHYIYLIRITTPWITHYNCFTINMSIICDSESFSLRLGLINETQTFSVSVSDIFSLGLDDPNLVLLIPAVR